MRLLVYFQKLKSYEVCKIEPFGNLFGGIGVNSDGTEADTKLLIIENAIRNKCIQQPRLINRNGHMKVLDYWFSGKSKERATGGRLIGPHIAT